MVNMCLLPSMLAFNAFLVTNTNLSRPGSGLDPNEVQVVVDRGTMGHVEQAILRASRENKRILLAVVDDWDGRFSRDYGHCKGYQKLEQFIQQEYERVAIDPHTDMAVMEHWKIKAGNVPCFMILDRQGHKVAQKKLLVKPGQDNLTEVLSFLGQWKSKPLNAVDVFSSALRRARKEHKKVFIQVRSPLCKWCDLLEAGLWNPKVHAILRKDYIFCMIEYGRMKETNEVLGKIRKSGRSVPWYAILDNNGQAIVTSTMADGSNAGFPGGDPESLRYFAGMLRKTCQRVTNTEIERVCRIMSGPFYYIDDHPVFSRQTLTIQTVDKEGNRIPYVRIGNRLDVFENSNGHAPQRVTMWTRGRRHDWPWRTDSHGELVIKGPSALEENFIGWDESTGSVGMIQREHSAETTVLTMTLEPTCRVFGHGKATLFKKYGITLPETTALLFREPFAQPIACFVSDRYEFEFCLPSGTYHIQLRGVSKSDQWESEAVDLPFTVNSGERLQNLGALELGLK